MRIHKAEVVRVITIAQIDIVVKVMYIFSIKVCVRTFRRMANAFMDNALWAEK